MILLTGITGNNGSATAEALLKRGVKFRALVRDKAKAADWADKGVELVQGDLHDPASVAAALDGCDKAVLILSNSQDQERLEKSFINSAKAAGVEHLVKLSSPEAEPGTTGLTPAAHLAVEVALKESGMHWTLVRPAFFMQNLAGTLPLIEQTGKLSMPLGNGTVALTDCADSGEFIAMVLTTGPEEHYGQTYDITGPDEVMNFHDIARVIGDVLGREVEYDDCDPVAYKAMIRPFLSSDWHSDAVATLFAQIADGTTPGVKTDTFQTMMGRPGTTFREFLERITGKG